MGLLKSIGTGVTEEKEVTRWFTILEEEDGEPEVRFLQAYLTEKQQRLLFRKAGVGGRREASPEEERKFRRLLFKATLRDWKGMTPGNLVRISEYFCTHPEAVAAVKKQLASEGLTELPFDQEDAERLAEVVTPQVGIAVLNNATELSSYAEERLREERELGNG